MFTDNRWGEKDQHRISLSNGDYGEVGIWFEEGEPTNYKYGICDHNFDLVDAHAICKTLGYTRASNFRTDSYYTNHAGSYSTRYYGITDLDCDANSQSLNDCQYTKLEHISYENCRTNSDLVGVTCVGKLNWS